MNSTVMTGLAAVAALVALAVAGMGALGGAGGGDGSDRVPEGATFEGRVFDERGRLVGPLELPTVTRSEAAWRDALTSAQYRIVRGAGTERPFTGALLSNKAEGVYTCVACGLPLFASSGKFESGTGWPSFFEPIAKGNVGEHVDRSLGMVRTEIHCARCAGHLGHVFPDGPRPSGLRYCVNSASLAFTPVEDVKRLADPAARTAEKDGVGMNETRNPGATAADGTNDPASPGSSDRTAVFAGGCFWCVEAVFEELDGVIEAVSGYAGGPKETANYQAVCSGTTGHAEAVQILYDPAKISYEDLLRVHFATHDPTQLDRQGNDVGPQYRSAIFYANDEEKALAQAMIEDLTEQKAVRGRIVTTLEPLRAFYPAETYHQNYVCNNPTQGYVRGVALPKVAKVRKQFKDRLKESSPLEKKSHR